MLDKTRKDNRAGYSLVELMVAMAVTVIVIGGIYTAYMSMHRTQVSQEIKAELQQSARNTLDLLTKEIMLAGYYGEIYVNNQNEFQFSEFMTPPGACKRVRYYLNGKNLMRQLGTTDTTPVWDTANVLAEGVKGLAFKYYTRELAEVAAQDYSTVPGKAVLKTIRRVVVQITVESSKIDPTTGKRLTLVFQADLYPANLAEGEGVRDNKGPDPLGVENGVVTHFVEVIDNRDCDSLQVKWPASTASDLAGYRIEYGTETGVYNGWKMVPLSMLSDKNNPQVKLTGLLSTKYLERTTNPTKYYIIVKAYDNSINYSLPTSEVSGPSDPSTDVSTFGTGTNDTVLNPTKPAPPSNFVSYNKSSDPAHCADNQVRLTWNRTSGATVGYRIYRSETPFTTWPISPTFLVADEVPTKVAKIDQNTLEYIDTVPIGCKDYYYAICSVNCDETMIHGDGSHPALYNTDTDYAVLKVQAYETVKPCSPDLMGTKGGYMRIYVNLTNPVIAGQENADCNPPVNLDFTHTLVYFQEGDTEPLFNADGTPVSYTTKLVFDSNSNPYTNGKFVLPGSGNSFVFNSATRHLDPFAQPELGMNEKYWLVAIAYDKCNNHSIVTTMAKTLATLCGDDPPGHPDSPTLTASGCGDSMYLHWTWAPIEQIDLQGYRVYRNDSASFPASSEISTIPFWGIDWTDPTVQDGSTYYYCVRATDCLWERIQPGDLDWDYNTIKANNISPVTSGSTVGPIYPGRIRRYQTTITNYPPTGADLYNFVKCFGVDPATFPGSYTTSSQHNAVKFYIQNTSAGNVTLNQIKLSWGNTASYLKGIRVGGAPGSSTYTDYTYSTPVSSASAAVGKIISVILSEAASKATAPGVYSSAIPVTLIFTNSDGTVSSSTDMRGDQINVQFQYQNMSTGKTDCISYMDALHGNPINVPGTPTLYNTLQNAPSAGTICFPVPGMTDPPNTVLSPVHPMAKGGASVFVQSYVMSNEYYNWVSGGTTYSENVGFKEKRLFYTTTDMSATAPPSNATWTKLTDPIIGDNLIWIYIPAQADKRIWFYLETESNSGNVDRNPQPDGGYFMYDQGSFNSCAVTVSAPQNLQYNSGTLTWNAVTTYNDGSTISTGIDPVKYYVFKRVGESSSYTYGTSIATVTSPTVSYTDLSVLTDTTHYVVVAANSCTTMNATYTNLPDNCFVDYSKTPTVRSTTPITVSNEANACYSGGGTGCKITLSTTSVRLNSNWSANTCTSQPVTITITDCSKAYNVVSDLIMMTATSNAISGSPAETSTVRMREIGDTGQFTYTGTSDSTFYINSMTATYNGSHIDNTLGATKKTGLSDNIAFTASGCSSASLLVDTDPCVNTPAAPALSSVTLAGNGANTAATLVWTAPGINTDGSTINDIKLYNIFKDGVSVGIVNAPALTTIIANVGNKSHTYTVSAVDTCNNPSAASNSITKP